MDVTLYVIVGLLAYAIGVCVGHNPENFEE